MTNQIKDLEDVSNRLKEILIADLNPEIDKINLSKGDEFLNHFEEKEIHLFFRGFPNQNKFIFIDITKVDVKTNYDHSAQIPSITIFCAFVDDTTDALFIKSLRIIEVLKNVILKNGDLLSCSSIEINDLLPFLIGDEKDLDVQNLVVSGIQFTMDYV